MQVVGEGVTDKPSPWVADNFVWLLLKVTITLNVPGVVGVPEMRQDIWVGIIGVGVGVMEIGGILAGVGETDIGGIGVGEGRILAVVGTLIWQGPLERPVGRPEKFMERNLP